MLEGVEIDLNGENIINSNNVESSGGGILKNVLRNFGVGLIIRLIKKSGNFGFYNMRKSGNLGFMLFVVLEKK